MQGWPLLWPSCSVRRYARSLIDASSGVSRRFVLVSSGDANQRGEMEVLVGQRDELDAASLPLQRISKHRRLRRPDDPIALLLPESIEHAEAWRTE